MNKSNMALYFPEVEYLNGSHADMCSDTAGALGDLFDFGSSSRSHTFTISPTTNATGRHHGFEHDYNSHTAFQGVLVVMHRVY